MLSEKYWYGSALSARNFLCSRRRQKSPLLLCKSPKISAKTVALASDVSNLPGERILKQIYVDTSSSLICPITCTDSQHPKMSWTETPFIVVICHGSYRTPEPQARTRKAKGALGGIIGIFSECGSLIPVAESVHSFSDSPKTAARPSSRPNRRFHLRLPCPNGGHLGA